jgi:hypothetical protein
MSNFKLLSNFSDGILGCHTARQADLAGHIPATSGSAGLGLRNFVSDRAQAGPRTVLSRASCHPLSTAYFPVLSSRPMK